MFRSSAVDPSEDPRLQALIDRISEESSALDGDAETLSFAEIERRAHRAGRELARRLCERAASRAAVSAERPRPCPDCGRPCAGEVEVRPLETRDGPIDLAEARHHCPHCRRAFFPRSTPPGPRSPQL